MHRNCVFRLRIHVRDVGVLLGPSVSQCRSESVDCFICRYPPVWSIAAIFAMASCTIRCKLTNANHDDDDVDDDDKHNDDDVIVDDDNDA